MILLSGVTKEEKAHWIKCMEKSKEFFTLSSYLRHLLKGFKPLGFAKGGSSSLLVPISGLSKDSIKTKLRSKAIRYFINEKTNFKG